MDYLIKAALILLIIGGGVYGMAFAYRRATGKRLANLGPFIGIAALGIFSLFIMREFIVETAHYEVTADKLSREFENNERATLAKYKNKIVSVTGVYAGSGTSSGHSWILVGTGGRSIFTFRCYLSRAQARSAERIQTARQLTLKGIVSGDADEIVMNECSLVK